MARVPYVNATPGESAPELVALYRDIAGLRGGVVNLYRALANQPAALRAFMTMSRYIRDDAELPANLRELAVLVVGYTLDASYEIYHHVPAARNAGVTEAQLAAFPDWDASGAFNPTERAILAYADQVARTHRADDATFATLQEHLPTSQIVDLTLTIGWYHLCGNVLGAFAIETEDIVPAPPISRAD